MNDKHKLKFRSNKSLVKLARDTLNANKFKIAYRDKYTSEKCFFLVKDHGIYLINCYSTKPNQALGRDKPNTIIYASGYNPKYNDNVWEDSYQVSRDDFAENIYLTDDMLERIAKGGNVDITLTPTSISCMA